MKRQLKILLWTVIPMIVVCVAIFGRHAPSTDASVPGPDQVAFERTKLLPDAGWTGEVLQCQPLHDQLRAENQEVTGIYKAQVKRKDGAIDIMLATEWLTPGTPVKYFPVGTERLGDRLSTVVHFAFAIHGSDPIRRH